MHALFIASLLAAGDCDKLPADLAAVRELDLDGCLLKVPAASLTKLKSVSSLKLGHNKLREVPAFLKDLVTLETLDLRGNELGDLPDWLAKLPKLKRLVVGDNCALVKGKVKVAELTKRFGKLDLDITTGPACDSE